MAMNVLCTKLLLGSICLDQEKLFNIIPLRRIRYA